MISGYQIRDLEVKPGLVLSPMSGVTTSAFRRLIKELNPGAVGLLVSEFISVEAMTRQVPRSLQMMDFHESERPYAIQIFGYDINRMRDAAKMVQDAGVDLLDINCGCPAPKVVRKGGGCELMRQPEHLAKLFREVRKAVSIPLTMKMRSGWDEQSRNVVEIAKIAEAEGMEGIAVHGRTRAQLYRGLADWDIVREVVDAVSVPVFGSGDVVDHVTAREKLEQSGVQGLFIGRGAIANPLIFQEIISGKKISLRHNPQLVVKIILRYVELLREEMSELRCVGKVKQLASQMCAGHPWKKDLCRAGSIEDQLAILATAGFSSEITATSSLADDVSAILAHSRNAAMDTDQLNAEY